ncbi:MAG: TRAP transporter substrate-binding protein [Alphaproteobacteria bacterium]|mgnify:FL=1|jgi:TRAP-type mannitol/chloroaromatic compound transport system substrate-binding protein|nr:TRAP transporter substrate-binding protein [Alphaproteobacteria bacterium]MBT4082413.1 TRAP transporter substrate-binding protein [Alphaproteobacteria bacterium]MBT4545955.1 TRAP transporter substrate-binding protein [Alphaproteobacteria bacterium]
MRLTKLLKTTALAGLVGLTSMAIGGQADAKVRWKMQSTFGSKLSILGETGKHFENLVKELSGGDMNIKFFEPGALVPSLEGFDAAKAGSVDAVWGTAGYHAGKIPAMSLFTAVPFGPRASELLGWMEYGGGAAIKNKVMDDNGLKAFNCGIIAPETSGWFKEPITSTDQLKGLKMRFFGMGAKVMTKLGASTQLLSAADIYPALERGVIQATEFSMPSIDKNLGFYQIAKHNYFPGWHQQSSILELLMNKGKWEALNKQQQTIIKTACDASIAWSLIRSDAIQADAMAWMQGKGVTLHDWSPEFIAKFRAGWDAVVKEEVAKDPLFATAYASYSAFRKKYKVWGDRAYLK